MQKKKSLLFIMGAKLFMSYRGKECASRTGSRGKYSLKRGEVKGAWIKETMMTGSEKRKAEKRNSSWKPEGKRLIGELRRRWDEMLKRILHKQDGRT